jgi:hypothetical protein
MAKLRKNEMEVEEIQKQERVAEKTISARVSEVPTQAAAKVPQNTFKQPSYAQVAFNHVGAQLRGRY